MAPNSTGFDTAQIMGNIASPLMIFGALSSTYGVFSQARSMRSQLKYQAGIADINARLSNLAARGAMAAGEREQQAIKIKTAQTKGSQIAGYAASGVDVTSATVNQMLDSTEFYGEVDALTAESNALNAAWGYKTQGVNFQSEAAMSRASASGINPTASAAGSLLGNAGYVASSYYRMKKTGVD